MTGPVPHSLDEGELLIGVIAGRVALLRKRKQQSFDELAARSGVSKGMLVKLEQGKVNPSISTLCRLASGLGVSVAELIATDNLPRSPVRLVGPEQARVLWTGPQGGTAELLVGSEGPDMLELWSWTLHPDERFEASAHTVGTLELLHVQQGVLALEVEGVTHLVGAGSSAMARTDRPHVYTCSGRKRVQFSMAVYEPAALSAAGAEQIKVGPR